MKCEEIGEQLSAFLEGDLSPGEADKIARHLHECSACRRVLAQLRLVREELRSLPRVHPPAELHETVMRGLGAYAKPEPKGFFSRFRYPNYRRWAPALAVFVILIVAVTARGAFMHLGGRSKTREDLSSYADDGAPSPMASPAATRSAGVEEPMYALGEAAKSEMGLSLAQAGDLGYGLESTRMIMRRAQLSLLVSRGGVKPASVEAVRLIEANQGYVESSSAVEYDSDRKEITSFYMVARIPSGRLDGALSELGGLGQTTREDISAQDVTDAYIDLEARLKAQVAHETSLLKIMGEAHTVGELLQVQGELSRVRGNIESMTAEKMYYDKAVSLSTISLTIAEEGSQAPKPPTKWSQVWEAFVLAWQEFFIFLARIFPALVTILALGAIGLTAMRKRRV